MSNTYSDGTTPTVCIIGSGFCGLCSAVKLKTDLGFENFVIYERNKDVGGIWLANTYPGCETDVPSHLYCFSFELNPNWSKHYGTSAEIQDYFSKVARKYDLYSHIKFETQVKSTIWVDFIKKWRVTIKNRVSKHEEVHLFDIVINACGGLRYPKIPEEFKNFKRPMWHSAEWEQSVDLTNKTVGIVGSGTSACQIIPNIVPKVKQLHVFQRRASWVVGRAQFEYSKFVKKLFLLIPFLLWLYRAYIFIKYEIRHHAFKGKSYFSELASRDSIELLKSQIPNNKDLQEAMTPKFQFGCKRLLVTNDYYPALNQSNCTVHNSKITKVTDNSIIMENGVSQELDVLILATGFRAQEYFAPIELIGANSVDILKKWLDNEPPKVYYGIVDRQVPNHFFLIGPNTAIFHSSVFFMAECQVSFIIRLVREMMARNAKTVTVKEHAVEEYMKYMQKHMGNTVWGTEDCGGWTASKAGITTILWPMNSTAYWLQTRKINYSHFDFE
ncbi:FAD-binding monooxygenase ktnD-like [Bradysia coprophila]|uniref:FAD-binding monooxygenase ktnD-like n=1 Tax=Bradysia coprophila TaxID=38358 RepID=UPI00187DB9DB|nr:FAD-binding monooxygenase ktnD-like [Bradysia coprophila]